HEQLGVGRGRQRLAYLIEHLDRGLELSEVEVRAGLALQEPGADLDRKTLRHREPALRHAEYLLVLAAHLQHLAEPEDRVALGLAGAGLAAAFEHRLVEMLRL